MKSLYNKSGILPALFMNSRVDCGIAWSEHRKVERVKREDIIQVEAPDLSAYLKGTIDGCIFKLRSQYAELSMISAKAGVALKEIDLHQDFPRETSAFRPGRDSEPCNARSAFEG